MNLRFEIQQTRPALTAGRACARPLSLGMLVGLAVTLWLVVFASVALAGPPNHVRTPELDLTGGLSDPGGVHPGSPFNQACGTAVDDKGNVYVASAGNDAIDVFNPAHQYLRTIANVNEPCGLAVDSKGQLYVSEKATGNVVRYVPNAYPFIGTPTYGAAQPIDSSGEAKGIAADPFDDRLYVAAGDRVDSYDAKGNLGTNEKQSVRVGPFETGGTFTLSFEGDETDAIDFNASNATVEAALLGLTTIGPGGISVTEGPNGPKHHIVEFIGKFARTDVPLIVADPSNLIGEKFLPVGEQVKGWSGHITENPLADYTGVAAFTYKIQSDKSLHYLFAADNNGDVVRVFGGFEIRTLKLHRTIDGVDGDGNPGTPVQEFGFGSEGAYLAVDRGNRAPADETCAKVGEQACTSGHLLLYDATNEVVDEFDATGEFLDQLKSADLADAEPTAMAVERSGGSSDGTIYVTSGEGPGAKLLAFGPLVTPSRTALPDLSRVLVGARGVAVDSHGNVYVAAEATIHVFDPSGNPLTEISDPDLAYDLAVDSQGNIYVLDGPTSDGEVTYYEPDGAYPPTPGATYTRHAPVLAAAGMFGVSVNPADDHLFVAWIQPPAAASKVISEFGSADEGSPLKDECGGGLSVPRRLRDIGVYGANGSVYVSDNPQEIYVIDCGGDEVSGDEEILSNFKGAGCPSGKFGPNPAIAVDQTNGHVVEFEPGQSGGGVREYDASGACVAEFGSLAAGHDYSIAIDNSDGPNLGNVYVAFDSENNVSQPFDVNVFSPLSYGDVPNVVTGLASAIAGGNATLNGTVDPVGFELEDCHFEYLTEAKYLEDGESFVNADSAPCVPTHAEIGPVSEAVAVHAGLTGLEAEKRYRFRLVAQNEFGESQGDTRLFGLPVIGGETALPILYDEATLRGEVDPSGLATEYHFEYGIGPAYGQSTAVTVLPPGESVVPIEVPLTELTNGTEYHFQLIAENDAGLVEGPDRTFRTLARPKRRQCPSTAYRTGPSAQLPDCRAYELVTPADTRGQELNAVGGPNSGAIFNNWLVTPRGPASGQSVGFFAGNLPGFEGTGETDGYRAKRGPGDHPPQGWTSEFYGPTYAQLGGDSGNNQEGVSADQDYWLWVSGGHVFSPLLPTGHYLRVPKGEANSLCNTNGDDFQEEFELVGCGTLGIDPGAESRFVSSGGDHVVFFSDKPLEANSPLEGTSAIYDRSAGEPGAEVVSVDPDGEPFGAGQSATYVAANEDGSSVVFRVNATLYLHRAGQTYEVAAAPNTFAGVSQDGRRIFYIAGASGEAPGDLSACDVEGGSCAGVGAQAPISIAEDAVFVNVAPDGSGVLFSSEDDLTGDEENEAGETAAADQRNLYAWDGGSTRFVAVLDAQDFNSFGGNPSVDLLSWTRSIGAGNGIGRGYSPTRATPDGDVFLFQSHARLGVYENDGKAQVYRYEPGAPLGERLLCVSCDPTFAAPSAGATLQIFTGAGGHTDPTTVIPNITDDGGAVFFHSSERLLPEDANSVIDVYEWKALGAGEGSEECDRPEGCLDLISTGQGEEPSTLYGMSADGHDVFFETPEKLVGSDASSSLSIYDARVEGGIPDPPTPEPCHGDACQPLGNPPPSLPAPATTTAVPNGDVPPQGKRPDCAKGKRKVKSKGKVRCVKKQSKSKRHHGKKRPSAQRRAQ